MYIAGQKIDLKSVSFYLRKLEKKEQIKPKVSRKKKLEQKSMELKIVY